VLIPRPRSNAVLFFSFFAKTKRNPLILLILILKPDIASIPLPQFLKKGFSIHNFFLYQITFDSFPFSEKSVVCGRIFLYLF